MKYHQAMQFSRYLIGIDLGTTNSAVAYVDTQEPITGDAPTIHVFDIPQLIVEGEVGAVPTLPSFLYFANEQDAPGSLRLPWEERPDAVVGVFAREQGALVPGRQVTSAKSWLCHDAVDRTAKILPWGAEHTEQACSPVEASTRYLAHLRDAWNHTMAAGDDELRFERQDIVLTVPASFDEEARELTVKAARDAGFQKLTLLEEPLAAFYAWIVARRRSLKRYLKDGDLVLICDVGGGTTDFSLIRVQIVRGEIKFERIAIGEHLLLGGDNVDLALARRVMEKLGNPKLSLRQQNALRRQCCAAKEKLLSDGRLKRVPVNILGAGRSVVGGTLSAELTRQEVEEALIDGFLPLTDPGDLPARERRTGLRELGLPYASEPAVTKHLAAFLTKSGEWGAGNLEMKVGESGAGKKSPLPTPHSPLPIPLNRLGQPEIEQLDQPVAADHHVFRLDVAVDDAGRMRRRQGAGDLSGNAQSFGRLHFLSLDDFTQRPSLHEFRRDEMRVAFPPDVMYCDDVGMIESRGRAGFALEAPHLRRVRGELRGKKFEGDLTVESGVAGKVDLAHPPGPDQREYLVVADFVADD
jgi:hypothetical protein